MAHKTSGLDTFPKLLLENADRFSEKPALREKRRGIWRSISWRAFADEVAALASALSKRGLKRGDHVAFVCDNRPRMFAGMAAVHALGAIAVPLYQDASAEELAGPINATGATFAFAENQEQVDKLLGLLPTCPTLGRIVFDEDRGMRHYAQTQLENYAALLRLGEGADTRRFLESFASAVAADDPAFVFLTSGTDGPPKLVIHAHGALIERARIAARTEGLSANDVTIAYLAPGWICQTLVSYVQPMAIGYCVCCPESSDTVFTDMREIAPTYFLATPRILDAILSSASMRIEDAGGFNLALYRRGLGLARRIGEAAEAGREVAFSERMSKLLFEPLLYAPLRDALGMSRIRVAYASGDVLDPDMLTFFRGIGINFKQLYGTAETGYYIALHRNGDVRADTVGTPAEGVELDITPEGEIRVKSPTMFLGYRSAADSAAPATSEFDPDGWFRTGDIGRLSKDGQLYIVDRASDIAALSDGTPFAPKPLENKLKFSPYVREAVAFGAGRDFVSMFVDIDTLAVGRWADTHEVTYTGHVDLASRSEVYDLVEGIIKQVNADIVADEHVANTPIARFVLLPRELTADEGLLTRTGKVRRHAIGAAFAPLIEAIYAGRRSVAFEGGAEGGEIHHGTMTVANLQIRDVGKDNVDPARRAAA